MNFNKYGRTAQLFDYQTMSEGLVGGILNSDGTIRINAASSSWTITKYIPVAGREFTLQRQASGGATSICLYDSNQTYITGLAYNGNGTVTVSANTDVSYIRFTYYSTENTGNIMLNEGSTALPYEPYGNTWTDIPHYVMGTATDTITTLPADLYPNDTTATVGLKGNMEQSGTPTPQNPIQPQECGDRTGNLFDSAILANNKTLDFSGNVIDSAGRIATTTPINVSDYTSVTLSYTSNSVSFMFATFNGSSLVQRTAGKVSGATIDVTNCDVLYISFYMATSITTDDVSEIMLNIGSEALPYEPYGYKIPISSASTTTPIYLGEVETTRKVRKYEITGQENWELHPTQDNLFRLLNFDGYLFELKNILVCNTYKSVVNGGAADFGDKQIGFYFSSGAVSRILYIGDSSYSTVSDFKTYLQQQYANGTPVTIWYVLAAEETAVVNEPIRKIGDYADTVSGITIPTTAGADSFDVLTTLKPSEVTANYHGWHTGAVHERDSGQWE